MNVGVVGIGLIGGSLAKAYSKAGHNVYAFDTDKQMLGFAVLSGAAAGELDEKTIAKCEIIFIALTPKAAIAYMQKNQALFPKDCIVMDCCGTKRNVCAEGFKLAEKNGYTYVGAHPMAGTQYSGFKKSSEDMFAGAPMVIVPPRYDDIELFAKIKEYLKPALFGSISITTAEKHDKIIAFTSQMAHIVSNAYIKSPTALEHEGYSAGSYKDLTRVAWLNEKMWAELFLENGDNLLNEIDYLVGELGKYRDAIKNNDRTTLEALLKEGRERKEQIDG